MAEQTVYCEECVEEIPANEVYWEDSRLYCKRCGSEVEAPDRDIFEEILDNRSGFLFRDAEPDDSDDHEKVSGKDDAIVVEGVDVVEEPAEAEAEDEDAENKERVGT